MGCQAKIIFTMKGKFFDIRDILDKCGVKLIEFFHLMGMFLNIDAMGIYVQYCKIYLRLKSKKNSNDEGRRHCGTMCELTPYHLYVFALFAICIDIFLFIFFLISPIPHVIVSILFCILTV